MQNAHCGGKVMDKIYFLVSYMPIWSCWSELLGWNHLRLAELTVMSTSIRNLRSAPSALLSYPPDESKSPKTLASGPIYGYNMASSSILLSGFFERLHMNEEIKIYALFPSEGFGNGE